MGVTGLLECPPDHTCHTDGGEWPPVLLQLGRVFKPFVWQTRTCHTWSFNHPANVRRVVLVGHRVRSREMIANQADAHPSRSSLAGE